MKKTSIKTNCFPGSRFFLVTLVCASVSIAGAQPPEAPRPAQSDDAVRRDPTMPSPEIQRRARIDSTNDQPVRRPPPVRNTTPRRVPTPRRSTRLVSGDAIVLQSLIRSSANGCTATLRAGDQAVTVSFNRDQAGPGIELPATQFADFASTVQQLSGELRQLRTQSALENRLEADQNFGLDDAAELESTEEADREEALRQAAAEAQAEMLEVERQFLRQLMQPQRIDLSSSFTLNGNLYRVIDFNRDTVLLEQVPLGKYLIVR